MDIGGQFHKSVWDRKKGSRDKETQERPVRVIRVKGGREDSGAEGGRKDR